VRRLAALGAALARLASPAPAAAEQLTVMTFNVWYGGGQVEFDRIGDAIEAAGADVVGLQEPEGQLRRIAEAAGMSYMDDSLHLISRYPIHPAQRGGIRVAYVALSPRRVVAVSNVHLPASPYGPHLVRDGRPPAQVLRNERATRLGEIRALPAAVGQARRPRRSDLPAGRLNSPSHLDWTPANPRVRLSAPLAGCRPRSSGRASATPTARRIPTRWRGRHDVDARHAASADPPA
jgi:hypothetical protein